MPHTLKKNGQFQSKESNGQIQTNNQSERWIKTWEENKSPWHLSEVNPGLIKYFPLHFSDCQHALVPLCGKSVDLLWLKARMKSVIGVELSAIALKQLAQENGIEFKQQGNCFRHDTLSVFCDDIFRLDWKIFSEVDFIYDRASLIALERDYRDKLVEKYLEMFERTSPKLKILLYVLNYPAEVPLDQGPPFSIKPNEVVNLFKGRKVEVLEHYQKTNPAGLILDHHFLKIS